jgi:hypothetical protein
MRIGNRANARQVPPLHNSKTERRGAWTKCVERFAYEFLDIGFPGRRACHNDSSIQGSHAKRTPGKPDGKLAAGIVQVVGIAKQRKKMASKGV